jgi:hypothetical protein
MRATVPRGDQDNGEFQSVQVLPIPADRIAFFDLETTGSLEVQAPLHFFRRLPILKAQIWYSGKHFSKIIPENMIFSLR